ncbi:hypothetical protein ACHAWO_007017 [Cyclotella atomus]|uniref:Kinesin motor domain-containing protein n=1 Tax=Cyclotella atomus TaxID=382360 RepID=A0ABD3PJJ8_9STRA
MERPSTAPPSTSTTPGCSIQVVVRLRPMNEAELRHGTLPVVTAKTADRSVSVVKGKGKGKQMKLKYGFDNVFTAFSTQEEVFEETVKPVIGDVMRGFESTVFAYGQTGTGKTHTMEGSLDSPELYGVIPRSAQAIFEHLKQPQYKEKVVTCSYLEIYNEELRDLLDDHTGKSDKKLDIMEGKDGTFCRGLTEKEVKSASDVLTLMQKAQHQRVVGETKMNKASSRSHCLFTITINGKIHLLDGDGDMNFTGKLHMVDLAGSECAKSAGNDKCPDSAAREMERRNINKSLLTLGRVITILKDKSQGKNVNVRVPYRDSKLTRILQESLGGRCKTVVVATLSPSITAIEESISTLNYAQSANGIINKPISESKISFGEQFAGKTTGDEGATVESWQEMEMRLQYMQTQVEEAQAALARKHLQQQELQERADKAEANLLENKQKLYNAELENKSLKGAVEAETKKRKQTEMELQHTQINLKKTSLILQATQTTETSLTSEALAIIETLEKVIDERNKLHSLVSAQIRKQTGHKAATKELQNETLSLLNGIESSLTALSKHVESQQKDGVEAANLSHEIGRQFVEETQTLVNDIANNVSSATNLIKSQLLGESGIAASVEASTSSISSNAQATSEAFVLGEESLAETCGALKSSFGDCAKLLTGKAAQIESSTMQTLKNFEAKITESKEALLSLIMKLKGSLSNLSELKAEKTDAMVLLVGEWRDQSLGNTQSVMDVTSNCLGSLKSSASRFKEEMHRHDAMSKTLRSQREFVGSHVAAHVNDISAQSNSLLSHRERLSECKQSHARLCEQVMTTIMSTVQSVVQTELGNLSNSQSQFMQALHNDGVLIAEANQRIFKSADQVMANIQSTNALLSEESSAILANDLKASEQMQSTELSLEQIATLSSNHHNLTSDFSTKNLAIIQDMKQLDSQNAQIAQVAESDGNLCAKSLVDAVLKPTAAAVQKSAQSSMSTLLHVDRAVIQKANAALDDLATKREVVATDVNRKLQAIGADASRLNENVASIVSSQKDVALQLNDNVTQASDTLQNQSAPYFVAELDSSKEKLVSTISNMSQSTLNGIKANSSQNVAVKQSIQDFALNKMQCNKPAPTAPVKKELKYSTDLSTTPAEGVILKGHNFNPVANADSNDPADEASNDASMNDSAEVDTSQEDDDNRSIMSSGSVSVSVPSPSGAGLKPRDINLSQASVPNAKRSRTQSRPSMTSNTAAAAGGAKKNKPPSGLRTPSESQSRKKMRM